MFKYKQSSDSSLTPTSILPTSPNLSDLSCTQEGFHSVALNFVMVPCLAGSKGCGGRHRKSYTGGWAKGMPRKERWWQWVRPKNWPSAGTVTRSSLAAGGMHVICSLSPPTLEMMAKKRNNTNICLYSILFTT